MNQTNSIEGIEETHLSLKKRVARMFLAIIALGIGLIGAELICRILVPPADNLRFVPDPIVGFRHAPNQKAYHGNDREYGVWFTTNSMGDPDIERTLNKSDDSCRIAVLGDSMTEAAQVRFEDRFTTLLEQMLKDLRRCNGRPVSNVEVLNFGVSAWGTTQELLYFTNHVVRFQPDLLLVMFFPANDVVNNSYQLEIVRSGRPNILPFLEFQTNAQLKIINNDFYENARRAYSAKIQANRRFAEKSRLFTLLARVKEALRNINKKGSTPKESASDREMRVRKELYDRRIQDTSTEWKAAWEITAHLFSAMQNAADHAGASFRVIVLPTAPPKNADSKTDNRLPHQRAKNILDHLDIQSTDLYDALNQFNTKDRVKTHFQQDGHLNPFGHRVVASELRKLCIQVLERETHK